MGYALCRNLNEVARVIYQDENGKELVRSSI